MKKYNFGSVQHGEYYRSGKGARFALLRPLLAAPLLLLLSLLFGFPSFAAQTTPSLIAPDTVARGDTVEARIEGAPDGALVNWSWEQGKFTLTSGSSETTARFTAVLDGTAWIEARIGNWRQRVSVVITRTDVITPTTPGGPSEDPKIAKSKQLLEQFRTGQINATQFFQNMGNEGISVKDLVAHKAHVIEQERKRLIAEEKKSPTEAITQSQDFWQREYAPYERDLMYSRQQGVNEAWERALVRYAELHPDLPYIGAKMDVGGWATETKAAMRFEGDIDFSIIMVDVEDAKQLRDIFEQEVKKMFNLNMVDIDALGTAHRAATEAVYIGDYGAKWAEIDAIRRGKMYKLKNVGDKVERTLMTEDEKIVMLAVLENAEHKKKTGENILDKILEEGGPEPKASMEPGVSLEFLRHVTVDAIRSQLSILEKIVKIAKYVNRSASDHGKFLQNVPNFTLEPRDVPLVKGVQAITDVKQDKALTPEQKIIKTMQLATDLMGEGWASDPHAALERLGQRATELLAHNIAEGIKAREKLVNEGNKTKQERDAERKQLLDDLQNEFKVFGEVGVPFPEAARAKMVELQSYFKRTFVLSPEEMRKIDEIMKRAAENPHMLKLYVASIWQKLVTLHKTVDEAIDGFNGMMDFMDNATVQHLRTLGDEISFKDGQVRLTLPINIARINQELNDSVLGKIGQSTTFKAFNLGQEGLSYYEAVAGGADWSESFTNLATEVFRRRVPGGGMVEAGMQGSYLYAGVQVVYLIFPTLAIPEGLYGMAVTMADWGGGKMNQWNYDAMVEALYTGATFQEDGAAWRMTGLSYNCPPLIELAIDKDAKTKEGLYKLLDSCAKVSSILYPQVKQHPALIQYEEMLENSAVSSGKMSIMGMNSGWPYQFTGLSRYGEELYKIYLKKVDDVTLEYFKGVVDGLEKRKAWDTGTGYSQIIAIEKELNCTQPLVKYTVGYLGGDAIKSDAERFQAIVDSYKRLKAANKGITDLGDKWQATFLKGPTPLCTPESIGATEKQAKDLLATLEKAVADARAEVVALVGDSPKDEDLAAPTRARLCMAYNDKASDPYRSCYEEHETAMSKLKDKGVDLTVAVAAMDEACVAQKITLGAEYNKPCPECVITSFQILDESGAGEEQLTPAGAKTPWTPRSAGRKTVQVNVDRIVIKDVLILQRKAQKSVTIKQEADCPKLAVALDAGGATEIGKDDRLTIFVRPVSLAPGNAPISRYFWKEDGTDKPPSSDPTYLLSGKEKGGKTVTITVVARDAENNLSRPASITIAITDSATPAISAIVQSIDPSPGPDGTVTIRDNGTASLKATVAPKADSGRLRFQWSANGTLIDPNKTHTESTIFRGAGWSGKTVTITLVVMDEKNREGRGAINVKIVPSTGLSVTFEEHPMSVTERDVMTIRVKDPSRNTGNFRYTWTRQGIRGPDNTPFDYLDTDFQGLADKTLTIRVDIYDDAGRTGFAETSIAVTGPKPEAEKIPVSISPQSATIGEDGQIELIVSATPFKDSGQLSFNNVAVPKGTTSYRVSFSGKDTTYAPPTTTNVTVTVNDEKGRTGEAVASIYVTKKDDKKDEKTADKTKDSGQSVTVIDKADTAKLSFAGAAPDIWEGGNYDNGAERGFNMKRKKASSKGAGECWDAYVESTIWGKIDPSFIPSTEGEILSDLNGKVEEAKAWGKTGQIRTIAIGDFKGHFMDTSVRFGRGGWSDAGYRGDSVDAEGHGYVIKGQHRIELGYNVNGGGCWTSEDQAFLEAQGHAAQDDAKAVLAGLQLVVNGSMAKTPYNGPKLDGSDMPKVTLSPPSLEKLKIGDTVNVQAVVENAKPEDSPFGYNWGGTFDGKPEDMKKTGSVKIKPSKPGKYNLSVSVDGARFNLGSASLAYEVADYKVKIERIPLDNNPVTMGGTVKLKAVLTVDGKETTGNLIFRWQPNTEVTFSNNEVTPDPKLPRNETVATLTKTGRIKIWVEVLDSRGSISSTVATSDQIELEVVQPKLKLTYEPKEPRAGQEVKITVLEEPKMSDNTISFWWEIKGEAVSPGPALNVPNSRAYSFKPKDTRPIIVTVHAKAKDGGNDLGSENITITPQAYTVSIGEPRYLESPPQVWRCDTQLGQAQHCGMVTLKPNEFVVFRDIFLSVTATPKPESPRYRWTIDPSGSCGSPGIGSEIKLNCSNTGTYTVKVEVTSADGAKLGEASRSVTISVSQNDLNNSKNGKDAYDKLQKAKEMVAQGKLDEGIPAVEEASKLDPKNTEASALVAKWKKDRDEIKLHITRMDQLLKDNKIADAEKELQPAQGLHPKYQSVVDAGKRLQLKKQEVSGKQDQAQKLKAEGNTLETQGKLQEAINKYKESIGITPDTSLEAHIKQLEAKLQQDTQKKATADTLWQDGMTLFNQKRMTDALAKFRESVKATPNQQRADYIKKLETEQSTAQKLTDEGAALQKQGKLTDASAKYKESIKHWPNPDLEKQIAALDDEAKKKTDTQSKLQQETQKKDEAQKKATADTLWQDGMTLFNQKRMTDALAKFRESVKATPNQQRTDYIKKLETEQSTAQKLNDEGAGLQKQGKLTEASAKYKESIKHWPNPDLEKQIAALDDEAKKKADAQSKLQQDAQKKATADNLWQEGTALFNQARPADALAKFKESLTYWQDATRAKYVQDLEGRRAQAQTLRDQGAQLQQQNRLQDAIAKYNQSLQYWPDSGLKDHIAKIEAEIKKQEAQVVTGKPTGSDASNAAFPLQVVRNVPSQNSSAFKQNVRKDLSIDTTKYDKIPYSMHMSSHDLTITAPGKFCLAGDAGGTKGWNIDNFLLIEVLDQSGNLISSAVAGNMETVRRNGNPAERIGRNSFSFDACEIDVTKLLPVGRPFRLRTSAMDYGGTGYVSDVFIVSSKGTLGTSTPPSVGTWTGTWKSDKRPGKEDVVLVLAQNSNRVTGAYNVDVIMPNATGGQQKTTMSGKLGGTISGNKVNGFFRDRQDKENTATFELTMASDGNSFTVAANSEGKTESWTARRAGSGQATVTPVPPPAPSFDGAYSGPIAGAASGTIQLSVAGDKASGTISGTYSGDRFTGLWSGTVNKTTGEVQGVLKGDVSGNAFTGSVAGRIQGTQASGTWNAKNQYGNPTGTWQATKAGSTSSKGSGITAGK